MFLDTELYVSLITSILYAFSLPRAYKKKTTNAIYAAADSARQHFSYYRIACQMAITYIKNISRLYQNTAKSRVISHVPLTSMKRFDNLIYLISGGKHHSIDTFHIEAAYS
jgi:hypothetical protein